MAPRATVAISGYQGHKPAAAGTSAPGAAHISTEPASSDRDAVRGQYLLHGNHKGQVPGYTGHFPRDVRKVSFSGRR